MNRPSPPAGGALGARRSGRAGEVGVGVPDQADGQDGLLRAELSLAGEERFLEGVGSGEGGEGRGIEVGLPVAALCRAVALDPGGGLGVEAAPAGEGEVAIVGEAEAHPAGLGVAGDPEDVVGGLGRIGGDAEVAGKDIHGAAGDDRQRGVAARHAVDHLVDQAVAPEGDQQLGPAVDGVPGDVDPGVAGMRLGHAELEAGLEGRRHQVLERRGHPARLRIHDQVGPGASRGQASSWFGGCPRVGSVSSA